MSRAAPALRLIDFAGTSTGSPRVGDVVRTGDNLYPHFEIIALSGDRAWVRDVQYGTDHVVPINDVHRIS